VVDQGARFVEMDAARLQRMFAINVFGTMYCCRQAVQRMSTRLGGAGGAIVNLSSVAAVLGSPGLYVDYAAAKGAIDTFTIGLGRELAAEGVRVNAVRPGIIDTEIHADSGDAQRAHKSNALIPMQRPGRAEEVAEGVLWLLSPQAAYVTGTILNVSGGR
jgi:NAD(P)-dependent dehydrogenase (short-subunit alcohol dehydrogenase family)